MADSNNARGAARASARKGVRKSNTNAQPKSASKARKPEPTKPREVEPAPGPATPRVAATIPVAERLRMIAEAAYYKAQRRGSLPGDSRQDWLEAEAEIDAMLLRRLSDG